MKRNDIIRIASISCYVLFLIVSALFGFNPGKEIGYNFVSFSVDMLKILPCAFILIGLFEVWVKRETVEKHFGEESGIRGYIWAVLLASTTVGGLYVAFPVAYSLYSKGAKLSIIFTYIGASAICRIPMTIFEASFLGIKFTAIRLLVSLPLVIVTSILLGSYLTKRNYKIIGARSARTFIHN
ncbi:permease [Chloroflexota bacterium]